LRSKKDPVDTFNSVTEAPSEASKIYNIGVSGFNDDQTRR